MKLNTLTQLIIGVSLGTSAFVSAAESSAKPPKGPKHHLTFDDADIDHNGGLSLTEFATLQGPGTPLVEVRRRFLAIDVAGAFEIIIDPLTGVQALDPITGEPLFGAAIPDGLVTKEELAAYAALEEKPKSDLSRFELADLDGDGKLSPVEFGYLVSPKVPVKNVLRGFDKLDKDDDGFISLSEFKKGKSSGL